MARRRTFGIISRPDADKTTLTEKLLLFSGAIHIARSVKARKAARHATSDWMAIEQDRAFAEEAWPGDIIGIHNHGTIRIGETFSEKEPLNFTGIPNFAPELFRRVRLKSPLRMKQLQKGVHQLVEEGAIQLFRPLMGNTLILGAVGVLQFEVTMARLKAEYGVDAVYEPVAFATARWIRCDDKKMLAAFEKERQSNLFPDAEGHLTYLAESEWRLNYTAEKWPEIHFHKIRECQ